MRKVEVYERNYYEYNSYSRKPDGGGIAYFEAWSIKSDKEGTSPVAIIRRENGFTQSISVDLIKFIEED